MNELSAVTAYARTLNHPNQRPRDAATLLVVDRTTAPPKVLLGKRHHTSAFMPGKFVFPGGRVDRSDGKAPFARPLDRRVEKNLMQKVRRPSSAKARAFALTAIRETFEETGLLIGSRRPDGPLPLPGPWRDFARQGFYPDLSALHLVARAITPPRYPRRFDARFFAVDAGAIVHRVDGVVHADAELVELKWLTIPQALELDLPDITTIVLQEIESRILEGFSHDLPVPFFRMRHGRFVRDVLAEYGVDLQ
jgi:8-oxo-dGTP pyrophosphatase MutT (NUDIX family)